MRDAGHWLTLAMLSMLAVGCASTGSLSRYEYTQRVMACQARVVVWAVDEETARAGARAAFARMSDLEAVMSDYRSDSELMRLCDRAGTGPVPVSDDLLRVLWAGEDVWSRTDGAFDPTVGPLVRIWREARRSGVMPDEDDLATARGLTGWSLVALDRAGGTVALGAPGMRLDLGGIGKGFAADEALAVLARAGIDRGLVDLGGDIAVGAAPPGTSGWSLAVDLPAAGRRRFTLVNAAVATSSDRVQFVEIGGTRFSHILDPRRGVPLTVSRHVTITAPSATEADALASALSVMGAERGLELIAGHPGVEAWMATVGPDGTILRQSSGFPHGE